MNHEPLTGLDSAFLSLEADGAPMQMGALAVFAPSKPVSARRLAAVLAERAGAISRLRRRVKIGWPASGWVEAADFDPCGQVRIHSVGGQRTLAGQAAQLMAKPLDPARPLWEVHVLTGLADGRFAVLVKLHHALTDGAGAVLLAAGLLDGLDLPGEPPPADPRSGWDGVRSLAANAVRMLTSPRGVAQQAATTASITAAVLRESRPTALAMSIGARPRTERKLATVRLDRDVLLRIRKLHGGTSNDAVLAVLAGTWRRWLVEHDLPTGPGRIRALIPVNLRGRAGGGHEGRGGNQLSGYLCELPVGEPDPARQLRAVRARMDANKQAGSDRGAGAFPLLAGQIPAAVHRAAAPVLRRSAKLLFDTVITNVPLPDIPLRLDAAALQEVYPIAPLAHGQQLAAGVSIYRDSVHIGLHAAGDSAADLDRFASAIPDAAAALEETLPVQQSKPGKPSTPCPS